MSRGFAVVLVALISAIVCGGITYFIFHITHTTELSANSIIFIISLYTFLSMLHRADKEL